MSSLEAYLPLIIDDPHWVDGIPYIGRVTEDVIRALPDTAVYDDDIYIAGYPKSGTNWLKTTVEAIIKAETLECFKERGRGSNILTFENVDSYQAHLVSERPRVASTHMRYNQLPKGIREGKAKVIHVSRNPLDVAVSFFCFAKISTDWSCFNGSWDQFFGLFMAGYVARGAWYDHMIDWMKYRQEKHIFFIKYEDFVDNPKKIISNVASFLERDIGEDKVDEIAELVSFKAMRTNPQLNIKHETFKGSHLRKGKVGDWVNYFSPEQEKQIKEMYEKFKAETGVELRLQ